MTHPVLTAVAAMGVVPVVEIDDAATAVPLARTLIDAGLPLLEVTFRTPAARDAVERIAAEFPDFLLGAGTLLDAGMVATAARAGARFGVSPGIDRASVDSAAEHRLPFVPGAVTPSEVLSCLAAGVTHVKFFPAAAFGGVAMIAALAGPFGWTGLRFMPTGGITAEQAPEYLALPAVFAVGGSWIAPRSDIAAGRWDHIGARACAAAALVAHSGEPGQ